MAKGKLQKFRKFDKSRSQEDWDRGRKRNRPKRVQREELPDFSTKK